MPIWIAVPILLIELAVIIGIGYTMFRWWKWWVVGVTATGIEFFLFQSGLAIWRSIFILKGIA